MIEELKKGVWPAALSRNHPVLSAEEQIKLLKSKVAVVGLGGLGGYLATLMARAGVGHLVLADGDVFDSSNLNRQLLATSKTIGKSKARTTSEYCTDINPEIKTTVWESDFTIENGKEMLNDADLVLDGLDQIPARKALFSIAMGMDIPYIHGAVAEWVGQTSTFLPKSLHSLDTIYKFNDIPDTPPSVLGPAVAVIAGLELLEAIKLLCGRPPANAGKLVLFDGEDFTFHKIEMQ